MKIGDPVTIVIDWHNGMAIGPVFFCTAVAVCGPFGIAAWIEGKRYYREFAAEGRTWLRGDHPYGESAEAQALLTARALSS